MKSWNELTHYAGFDWAGDHHDVVIVNAAGERVAAFRFEHGAAGWEEFRKTIQPYGALGVAVETRSGAAVEELLNSACSVFPVQPQAAARYCERKAPSGVKDDVRDAWALADALRLDGRQWRPEDPLLQELRLLCRDEVALIQQRTLLVNQLQAALREYYDPALQAFEQWTKPGAWAFVVQFPTPEALAKAGKRQWEKFLHVHKLWRTVTAAKRFELFAHAADWKRNAAVTQAKSRLAVSLAKLLLTLEGQLVEYRRTIESRFAEHPDHDLFGSLPGVGAKLAPRLMSEVGADRGRWESPRSLQCLAGTAPVSFQSGQIHRVKMRRACNQHLRHAVHLWANCSRPVCGWAQAYYQAQRQKGKSHACALRCLGHRWLEVLWKMWQTQTRYDGDLHARNQQKHGSWVIQILTAPTTPAV
jgi:transposase